MQETQVRSLGQEDPLEKEMVTLSSTLAWRIPWMEEPGGLQSTGSQRVGHNWVASLHGASPKNERPHTSWPASLTQWTWIWAKSRRQWRAGRPAVHGVTTSWTWPSNTGKNHMVLGPRYLHVCAPVSRTCVQSPDTPLHPFWTCLGNPLSPKAL